MNFLIVACSFTTVITLNDPFWRPKEGIFILLGLIFLSVCWLSEKRERYVFQSKWLGYFFIYTVLCFGWYFIYPMMSDSRALDNFQNGIRISSIPYALTYAWWNLLPTLNILIAILIVHHLVEYTDTTKRWVNVTKVICWSGVAYSVYAILQFINCDQILQEIVVKEGVGQIYKMCTFMGNKMLSSNFIACIIPLFLIFKSKKYFLALGVSLVALCLFRSAFNLGAAVLGICIVLLLQKRWKLVLIIIICSLILTVSFRNKLNIHHQLKSGFNGRIGLMKKALIGVKGHILTGHGAGSLPRDFAKTRLENEPFGMRWHSTHNILIDVLYEFGLIGVVLLIGYLCNLFKRIKEVFRDSNETMILIGLCGGLGSWLMVGMGSFPHRIAPLALLGILYIAGIEVHLSQRRRV